MKKKTLSVSLILSLILTGLLINFVLKYEQNNNTVVVGQISEVVKNMESDVDAINCTYDIADLIKTSFVPKNTASKLITDQIKNWKYHSLYKSSNSSKSKYMLSFDSWLTIALTRDNYHLATLEEVESYWEKDFKATVSEINLTLIWRLLKRIITVLGLGSLPMVISGFLSSLTATQIGYAFATSLLLIVIMATATRKIYAGDNSTTIIEFDLNSTGGQNSQTWCLIQLNKKSNVVLLAPESGFWATYGPLFAGKKYFSITGFGPIFGEGNQGVRIDNILALNLTTYDFGYFSSLFFGCFGQAIHPETTTWAWYKIVNYVPLKKFDCQLGVRFDQDLWKETSGWKQTWSLGPILKKKFNAITAQMCLTLTEPRQFRLQFETSF